MRRAVFMGRDGTLIQYVTNLSDPNDVVLKGGVVEGLTLLYPHFTTLIITNQPSLGRGDVSRDEFQEIQLEIYAQLREGFGSNNPNVTLVDGMYVCPHTEEDGCECRKPQPALLFQAASVYGLDLRRSYMIGSTPADVMAGRLAGCKTVCIGNEQRLLNLIVTHRSLNFREAAVWVLGDAEIPGEEMEDGERGTESRRTDKRRD